jgi:nucleoside-diphosphate kinase
MNTSVPNPEITEAPTSRTFAIIKPDAVKRQIERALTTEILEADFIILAQRNGTLSLEEAQWLYREHKDKPWFNDQIEFMVSGTCIQLVLRHDGENCAADFRKLMGPTDPADRRHGDLRWKYATGHRHNCLHGSDSAESAQLEIAHFFSTLANI